MSSDKVTHAIPVRCPRCNHPEHNGRKCLQALRIGKPGEDHFCLCALATPRKLTREQDGWQPIESAPKDGTQVLGFCEYAAEDRKIWIALWIDDDAEPDGGFWRDASHQDSMTSDAEPTHWHPLPAPPSSIEVDAPPEDHK